MFPPTALFGSILVQNQRFGLKIPHTSTDESTRFWTVYVALLTNTNLAVLPEPQIKQKQTNKQS